MALKKDYLCHDIQIEFLNQRREQVSRTCQKIKQVQINSNPGDLDLAHLELKETTADQLIATTDRGSRIQGQKSLFIPIEIQEMISFS